MLARVRTTLGRYTQGLSLRRAQTMLFVVAVASVCAQLLLLGWSKGGFSIATATSASAVCGLMNGRGMTVAQDEVRAAFALGTRHDLLPEHRADAVRMPQRNLPGFTLLLALLTAVTGQLKLGWMSYAQILMHAFLAVLLARELMRRDVVAGFLAGGMWLFCLPFWRMNLPAGYDAWTSFASVGVVTFTLRFLRNGSAGSLWLTSITCGLGLWIRDYFFVVPVLLLVILVAGRRLRWVQVIAYVVPIAVSVALLSWAREASTGGSVQLTRGAHWHTFWAGVGQFPNAQGVVATDGSVAELAERLSGGKQFGGLFHEWDSEYNGVLETAGRAFIREHPWILVRNALLRCLWLVVPGAMPSFHVLSATAAKVIAFLVSALLTWLAILGFRAVWANDGVEAMVIAVPWLSLFPLTAFYIIAKVVALVLFVWLVFAGMAISRWIATNGCALRRPSQQLGV